MSEQHRLHVPDDLRKRAKRLVPHLQRDGTIVGLSTVRIPHVERIALARGLEILEKKYEVKR